MKAKDPFSIHSGQRSFLLNVGYANACVSMYKQVLQTSDQYQLGLHVLPTAQFSGDFEYTFSHLHAASCSTYENKSKI